MMLQLIHLGILIGLVITAVGIFAMKDLLASAILLAAFSLLMALEFYILQAPDVAVAEAGIGAALTTAIYVIAIRSTRRQEGLDE